MLSTLGLKTDNRLTRRNRFLTRAASPWAKETHPVVPASKTKMLFDVRRAALFATIPAFVLVLSLSAQAQSQALITAPVDDSQLVTLAGNTRAEAIAANDRGPVDDSYLVDHMFLQLRR